MKSTGYQPWEITTEVKGYQPKGPVPDNPKPPNAGPSAVYPTEDRNAWMLKRKVCTCPTPDCGCMECCILRDGTL